MQESGKNKDKDSSMLLALLLFLGAGGMIFAYLTSSPQGTSSKPKITKTAKYEKSVNRHLMMTNERMLMEKQKMELESARLLNNGARAGNPQSAYQNDNVLDLSHDQRAQEMAKELGRSGKTQTFESPDDIIQHEVLNQEQLQRYSEEYKREYARQFVENARRGGYKVILTDDLTRVKTVIPIQQNKGMLIQGSSQQSSPLQ